MIGMGGLDTRALTTLIRVKGMPNAVIAHEPSGRFDFERLKQEARDWPGLIGMDLVPMVTCAQRFSWDETAWQWGKGYGRQDRPQFNVVAIDYGIKRNILRQLAGNRCKVTVVPATTQADEIAALEPDGVFLSIGPGDPAATGQYAVPVIREIMGAAFRPSASASAIKCSASRWEARQSRCTKVIMAQIIRSRTSLRERSRSHP